MAQHTSLGPGGFGQRIRIQGGEYTLKVGGQENENVFMATTMLKSGTNGCETQKDTQHSKGRSEQGYRKTAHSAH